jgi:CRISPR-associated protein Csb2
VFAIAIELLAERYTAMQFNDRSQPEWPPHPARLYSAMVAAWADSDEPDPAERAALCWLEEQAAPEVHCSEAQQRAVVTHFVPVNDAAALSQQVVRSTYASLASTRLALVDAELSGEAKALQHAQVALTKAQSKAVTDSVKAEALTGRETSSIAAGVLEVLPESRGKQGRTYPTVIPDQPTVWFVWPGTQPAPDVSEALDALLARVARLGHSSTLVSCRASQSGPGTDPAWVPGGTDGQLRIRVLRKGLLDRLELAFATHHGEEPRTLPARMLNYQSPKQAKHRETRIPNLGGAWYILGFVGRPYPAASQALAVTRAARAALMGHAAQPVPEVICGHKQQQSVNGPTPPLADTHLAIVPLLNAGNPRSDGTIYGIALVLPAECRDEDRIAVDSALRTWAAASRNNDDEFFLRLPVGPDGRLNEYSLMDLGVDRSEPGTEPEWLRTALTSRRKTTTRGYWCRPAKRWLTVTPIALDRFPGNLRSVNAVTRDRAESQAAASVARACVNAGLVDRAEDVKVFIRLDAPLVGIPAAPTGPSIRGNRQYPGFRTGGGAPRACVHAEIEFPEPVQGPVLVGAGRYFGYGLCLPHDLNGESK